MVDEIVPNLVISFDFVKIIPRTLSNYMQYDIMQKITYIRKLFPFKRIDALPIVLQFLYLLRSTSRLAVMLVQ